MANTGTSYTPGTGQGKVPQFFGTYDAYIAVNQDPLDTGRVKLRIPQVFGATTSGWADPVVPLQYVPAVGTPCVAMFRGGDPRKPVWLGNFAIENTSAGVISGDGNPNDNGTTGTATGEIYFDVSDGTNNGMWEWNGAGWVEYTIGTNALADGAVTGTKVASDAGITGSQLAADAAIASSQVDFTAREIGGNTVTVGPDQPSSAIDGDTWIETDGSNDVTAIWTYDGTWNESTIAIATASGVEVTASETEPSAPNPGDLWINESNGNVLEQYDGTTWNVYQYGSGAIADGAITTTQIADDAAILGSQLAAEAGISASQVSFTATEIGGIRVSISGTEPGSPADGDLWFNSSSGYQLSEWDGTEWAAYQFGTNALEDQAITAALIQNNAITSAQISDSAGITGTQIANETISLANLGSDVTAELGNGVTVNFGEAVPGSGKVGDVWMQTNAAGNITGILQCVTAYTSGGTTADWSTETLSARAIGSPWTYQQSTTPNTTNNASNPPQVNDLWINTASGNVIEQMTGGTSASPTWTQFQIGGEAIASDAGITGSQLASDAGIIGAQLSSDAAITGSQLSSEAGIVGTQLSSAANIAGSQLSASAGLLGSQISDDAGILGSQLSDDAGLLGSQLASDASIVGTQLSSSAGITGAQIAADAGIVGSQIAADAAIVGSQISASAELVGTQFAAEANIVGSQLSATAGIAGTQLADEAGILGTQLAAEAGILGTQISAEAGLLGSQLAAEAGLLGSQLAEEAAILGTQLANGTVGPPQIATAPLGPPPVVVASGNSGTASTSYAIQPSVAIPAGSNLIVGVGGYTTSTSFTVGMTDSGGNSYLLLGGSLVEGEPVWLFHTTTTTALTTSSTITATATVSQVMNVIAIQVPQSSSFDVGGHAYGTGTAHSATTTTAPSYAPSYAIGFDHLATNAPTWGSGITALTSTSGGGGGFFSAAYMPVTSTASAVTMTASESSSTNWLMEIIIVPCATGINGNQISAGQTIGVPNIYGGTITGSQFIATGSSGDFLAYNGTPGSGNLYISMSPAADTTPYGQSYDDGITVFSTQNDGSKIVIADRATYGQPGLFCSFTPPNIAGTPVFLPEVNGASTNPGASNEYMTMHMGSGGYNPGNTYNLSLASDSVDQTLKGSFILDYENNADISAQSTPIFIINESINILYVPTYAGNTAIYGNYLGWQHLAGNTNWAASGNGVSGCYSKIGADMLWVELVFDMEYSGTAIAAGSSSVMVAALGSSWNLYKPSTVVNLNPASFYNNSTVPDIYPSIGTDGSITIWVRGSGSLASGASVCGSFRYPLGPLS